MKFEVSLDRIVKHSEVWIVEAGSREEAVRKAKYQDGRMVFDEPIEDEVEQVTSVTSNE